MRPVYGLMSRTAASLLASGLSGLKWTMSRDDLEYSMLAMAASARRLAIRAVRMPGADSYGSVLMADDATHELGLEISGNRTPTRILRYP